jgi:hypothetical protein
MRTVIALKNLCEYFGGESDMPPIAGRFGLDSPLWGVWWGILGLIIALFCGQSSKFIYIDF